jgi:glutaredoxin 3
MSAEPADFVNSEIGSADVVVFSKTFCPFCKATKSLMEDLKIDAKIIELDEIDNGAAIQDALKDLTGQRTVPNVFIKGQHLGGNDVTQAAAKSGKLQKLLGM